MFTKLIRTKTFVELLRNLMTHIAETTFRVSPKRTSPFKSAGEPVQSTAGSRGVRISVSNAGYTTCRGVVRVLVTPSIRQFPLHFPSRASPYATTFRTQYNAGYITFRGRVRVLATHSIRLFSLHFPSCASPCAITFRTQYTDCTFTIRLRFNLLIS